MVGRSHSSIAGLGAEQATVVCAWPLPNQCYGILSLEEVLFRCGLSLWA